MTGVIARVAERHSARARDCFVAGIPRWSARPGMRAGLAMSFITGVGLTSFGRHEGSSTLDLMSKAAALAIADAGLKRAEIDGMLCGYSTVSPHIMLATVFAEHFGIRPVYAHAVQVGGATGLAMTMLAHHWSTPGWRGMCWWWRREPADRAKPRRIDPGAGAGRPSRLRGAAGADHPGLLRPGRLALHARIWRDAGRPRRIRGADARSRAHPSRRAVSRADHGRRRDGIETGGAAAETAGLLSGVGRRRGVRRQPRARPARSACACAAARRPIPTSMSQRRRR